MAPPADHRRCHGSAPAGEAEAQRATPLVHRKTLRAASGPRPAERRLAPHLVRVAKFHPPPSPFPPPLVVALEPALLPAYPLPPQRFTIPSRSPNATLGRICLSPPRKSTPIPTCSSLHP